MIRCLAAAALAAALCVPSRAVEVLVVAGFEPFGDRTRNVSWDAVRAWDGRRIGGLRVRTVRLPVVWGATEERIQWAARDPHDSAVFFLGFGEGAPGAVALERYATNRADTAIRDERGSRAPSPWILENGPSRMRTSADLSLIEKRLHRDGVPVRISDDAGAYLCEEAYYHMARLAPGGEDARAALFVHLPAYTGSDTSAHLARMRRAVRAVIEEIARWYVR